MTCDERKDELLLYAAGALDDAERDALAAHLATGCPQCAGALAEAEATVAHLPMALPPIAPPLAARERLMQRVREEQQAVRLRIAPAHPSHRFALAMAASIGLVVGAVAMFAINSSKMSDMHRLLGQAQMISLEKMPPQPKAKGRVIWDRDKKQWHVYVFDMMPPKPGETYELWFITPDQKKIRADTFMPDADGKADLVVSVPDKIGPIALAAITNEPMGGVQTPTGQVQLKGEVPTP